MAIRGVIQLCWIASSIVMAGEPPNLTRHPLSQRVMAGHATKLIGGSSDIKASYQWEKDGKPLPGATSPELNLRNIGPEDEGDYALVARNSEDEPGKPLVGESVSRLARVSVLIPPAGPGEIDRSWRDVRISGKGVRDLLPLTDGGVLLAGEFKSADGQAVEGLLRINGKGEVVDTFPALSAWSGLVPREIVAQAKDWLLGGAYAGAKGQQLPFLARLRESGQIDPDFRQPSLPTPVRALAVQFVDGEQRVLVGLSKAPWLVRLLENGAVDRSFDSLPPISGTVNVILPQPDGRLLVAGGVGVARLLANGSADKSFTNARIDRGEVLSLVVDKAGRIILGGAFQSPGFFLARLQPSGPRDDTFSAYTNGIVECLALLGDNLLVGGDFSRVNGGSVRSLCLLTPEGKIHPDWCAAAFDDEVQAVGVDLLGRVWAGGRFEQPRERIVRLLGSSSVSSLELLSRPPARSLTLGTGDSFTAPIRAPKGARFAWFRDGIFFAETGDAELPLPLAEVGHAGDWTVTAKFSGDVLQAAPFSVRVVPPAEGARRLRRLVFTGAMAVPDNDQTPAEVALAAPVMNIDEALLSLSIDHNDSNDLTISLATPSGQEVRLFDPESPTSARRGRDFAGTVFADAAPRGIHQGVAPYHGTYRPSEETPGLADLAGPSKAGTWKLRVRDIRPGGALGKITFVAMDFYEPVSTKSAPLWASDSCLTFHEGLAVLRHVTLEPRRRAIYEVSENLGSWTPSPRPLRLRRHAELWEEAFLPWQDHGPACYLRLGATDR